MGLIFDIKRYAIHDGPGIRTTIFLKGCALTCFWCHNPEGRSNLPQFMWWKDRCIQCRACENACTPGALSFPDGISLDESMCTLCKACIPACHSQALELIGREMTVDEVIKEIEKDTLFYDESKGGVTFSGGEPLMQPDFLIDLLKSCKTLGIHTAVDTCGYAPEDILLTVSQYIDLFLYDVKVLDDEIHKKVTGVSNRLILHNLKELLHTKKKVIVRIPLIPGVNDREKDLLEIGEVIASFHAKDVSVLPYHTAGVEKAHRLRMAAHAVDPPSDDTVDTAIQTLKKFKLNVKKGG